MTAEKESMQKENSNENQLPQKYFFEIRVNNAMQDDLMFPFVIESPLHLFSGTRQMRKTSFAYFENNQPHLYFFSFATCILIFVCISHFRL